VRALTVGSTGTTRLRPGARYGDLWFSLIVGGAGAVVLAFALTRSLQAASAVVIVVGVIGLHQYDRRWGIAAMFALWFLAPGLRRLEGLATGYVESDPLSLAPVIATGAVAALELMRLRIPTRVRRILMLAALGFAIGLPVGLLANPAAAVYAFLAYLAGVAGAALGMSERTSLRDSTLRRVLLVGLPVVALYAFLQRLLPLPPWDLAWVDATEIESIGTADNFHVRVFGTLNSPGTLAGLLGLGLLAYLTIRRPSALTIVGVGLVAVAMALTYARSGWVALVAGGVAHLVVTNGRSARAILGSAGVIVAATLVLAPVSPAAREVVDRFKTITDSDDASTTERRASLNTTFPVAAQAPFGHGLGTTGEASKLTGDESLRGPDNGYLQLIYQIGPIGLLLVLAAAAFVLRAAWEGARARAPGQELRQLFFALLVYLLVLLAFGDALYGVSGVIFWFIAGQVLAYDWRRRAAMA
jgi:O-Antigen ligase